MQVVSLKDGRLLWPECSVVSADDTLLLDCSFWALRDEGSLSRHPLGRRWLAPRQRHLRGRVLALTSDHHNSFGHFLLDAFPRLDYVQRAGFALSSFATVVCPHPASATADRLIAAAGIAPEQLLNPTEREDLVCDELVCTTFPGQPGVYPPDLPAFYRRLLGLNAVAGTRRLYLSRQRQDRRRVANHSAIEGVLLRHGFETVYPESDPEIIRKCAEAEYLVGIEGSNFTNQVFAAPGGAVLLLVAANWYDLPYVFSVATAAGKAVYTLTGQPVVDSSDRRSAWVNPYDIIVDPDLLDHALTRMTSGKG